METEIIKLKKQVEKLQRECLEKYSEIQALKMQKQNEETKQESNAEENPQILFQLESPVQATSSMLATTQRIKETSRILAYIGTEHQLRVEKMKNLFEGKFEYKESPYSMVNLSRWEFVIVCPNPDNCNLRNTISKEEAYKYFHKGFRPDFTKKIRQLRINQAVESRAFNEIFSKLNGLDNEKAYKNGGRFFNVDNLIIDTKSPPKDYLSLMRNILLVKLGLHLGLHTKQVMSSNGKYIYILICANDQDLKNEAESTNYNLQLEIGEIDLPSLEPVDDNLRPLRILKHDDENIKRITAEIASQYSDILDRFKISENDESQYDPAGLTPDIVNTYKEYLIYLKEGLKALSKSDLTNTSKNIFLQKLLKNSIIKANEGKKKEAQIKNLWTRLGFDKPIAPYIDFFQKIDPATNNCRYEYMWKKHETQICNAKSVFSSIDRLKILMSLIKRQINIEYLQQKEIVTSFFPLKNDFDLQGERNFTGILEDLNEDVTKVIVKEALQEYVPSSKGIQKNWTPKFFFAKLPVSKIRSYFGEKIGFYFAFISYFTNILSAPCLIGIVVFILQRIYDPSTSLIIIMNIFYCIYTSIWATAFVEFWKRKETSLCIRWGQTDYKEDEVPRPQFIGESRRSPIDDEMDDTYFDPVWRYKYYAFSILVTGFFIALVILTVLVLRFVRSLLNEKLVFAGFDLAGPIVSIINAFQIQILNIIFNKVAVKLTNLENHRTQSDYENSLILKCYVFQFINSFFSLFYISFIKSSIEGCMVWEGSKKTLVIGASCVDELYTQFITIFTVAFLKNGLEVGMPFFQALKKSKEFTKVSVDNRAILNDITKLRKQIDSQFALPSYITRDVDGTLGDYLELAVLYGYITLFAVAFPLSGVLAFISILVEIQVDRYKLLYLVKRPIPIGAKDISTWKTIFIFNSIASIMTNSALICFSLPTFDKWTAAKNNLFLIFAIFSLFMLGIRSVVSFVIPDVPNKYDLISKRHLKIAQRFIKGWEITAAKGGSTQVYVNPEISCTTQETFEE